MKKNKDLVMPKLVVSHPELSWNEKAVLSLIIQHYQTNNDAEFSLKDKEIGILLGLKVSSVYPIISQLYKKNLINKITKSIQVNSGQKPKNVRYITLVDIAVWTIGNTLPTITARTISNEFDTMKVDMEETEKILVELDESFKNETIIIKFEDVNSTGRVISLVKNEIANGKQVVFFDALVDFGDGDEPSIDTFCLVNDYMYPEKKYVRKAEVIS